MIKYQVTPIIDILSTITKKLEIIPFESDLQNEDLEDEVEGTFNVFGLCEKYVSSMKNIDPDIKVKVLSKITQIYQKTIKDEK